MYIKLQKINKTDAIATTIHVRLYSYIFIASINIIIAHDSHNRCAQVDKSAIMRHLLL